MAHTDYFKFKNIPNPIIEKRKQWIRENPRLALMTPEKCDEFKIEVFGHNEHKKVATDLYNALLSSGFLDKYPLYHIRIDPMQ